MKKMQLVNYRSSSSGRRASIATLEDQDTQEKSSFICIDYISTTTKSSIRLFSNLANETIVVKGPRGNFYQAAFATAEDFHMFVDHETEELARECSLMHKAYPNESPYNYVAGIINFIWSYRLVMPHIKGYTFKQYAAVEHSNQSWLLFFLAIAKELQRIHQCGVIHGDIKKDNGLVQYTDEAHKYNIHFIDFGSSYLIDDTEALVTAETGNHTLYWAPERRRAAVEFWPAPDPKQDVFSYGYMLLEFIAKAPELTSLYPTLLTTIMATQNEDPELRPDLDQIITEISSSASC